jgi:hypothetical protein
MFLPTPGGPRSAALPRFLACLALTAATVFPARAATEAAEVSGANLFRNPNFTTGSQGWQLEVTKPAAATLEVLGHSMAPQSVEGSAVRIHVSALGSERWHVQFYQAGLDLLEGEPYTLAFWARAEQPRPLSLNANVNVGDGHGIGLTVDGVSLTQGWRKYAFTFTPNRVEKNHCRVTLLLGEARGAVMLAGMVLRHGKATAPTGPNLLMNGSFSAGAGSWQLDKKAPADGTLEIQPSSVAPPGVSSRVAHVDVKNTGQETWHIELGQNGLDLEQGETYTLSFWARADKTRPLTIVSSIDMPDWHRIAPDSQLTLSPDWKRLSVSFTAAHTAKGHNRVVFLLGDTTGTIDLADVSLQREALLDSLTGAPGATDPGRRHALVGSWISAGVGAAQRVLFTFNGDGTGSVRSGASAVSTGAPKAPVTSAFRWYVKPSDAKQVVIGDQIYRWAVTTTGDGERLVLTDAAGKGHTLVRTP